MSDGEPLPHWDEITSAEKRAVFEPLWRDGKSAGEIALHHFRGASRNAVIGAISRAKLQRAPGQVRPKKEPKPRAPRPKPAPRAVPSREMPLRAPPAPESTPADKVLHLIENPRPPLKGVPPISMLELPGRPGIRCRFPVQGGYCGASSGEHMYCRAHWPRVYTPEAVARMEVKANASVGSRARTGSAEDGIAGARADGV